MLTLLFLQLGVSATCFCTGVLWYLAMKRKPSHPVFYLVSGLVIITALSQLLSLVLAITPGLLLGYVLALMAISWRFRQSLVSVWQACIAWFPPIRKSGWLLLPLLLTALLAADLPRMDDAESYHAQIIRWLTTYPVVPGIANLHERFGFQSSFFPAQAFFMPFHPAWNHLSLLNSTLFNWLVLYLGSNWLLMGNGRLFRQACLLFLLLTLLPWALWRGGVANSNYDLVSVVLFALLLFEQIRVKKDLAPEWLLWTPFLLTVRLMHFPLLLPALFSAPALAKSNKRWLLGALFTGFLLVTGFLLRNYFSSGYLFFPSMAFDWFQPDWKLPGPEVQQLLDFIHYYNRISTQHQWIDVTREQSWQQWLPLWFGYLSAADKTILLLAAAGGIYLLVNNKRITTRYSFVVALTLLLQVAVWWLIAPDPRFAYAVLLPLALLPPLLLLRLLPLQQRVDQLLPAVFIATLLLVFVQKAILSGGYRHLLQPELLPRPPLHNRDLQSIRLYIPEKIENNWNARCYDAPLPCLYDIKPGLTPRGNRIEDGFRRNFSQ